MSRGLITSELIYDYDLGFGGNISEGYYSVWTRTFVPSTQEDGYHQGIVVDKSGNVFRSNIQSDVRYMTVYNGTIWLIV